MITLVSKTIPLVEGVVDNQEFVTYVARIGRVKDNSEKLLKYLISNKHWSPFEHSYFTFKITTSRAIGRELLRHRSFTFQELSQRYEKVNVPKDFELRKQSEKNRQSSTDIIENEELKNVVETTLMQCQTAYDLLIKNDVSRESARFILPGITDTTILMTGNIRSWIHFLELRLDENSQKEIRELSSEILEILKLELPLVFNS